MLGAEHRAIGVVVDRNELRSPEENDLRLRRQQDADRAAQALRPALDGAERRVRPLFRADEGAHFTAPYQPIRCQGPGRFCGWIIHCWQAVDTVILGCRYRILDHSLAAGLFWTIPKVVR